MDDPVLHIEVCCYCSIQWNLSNSDSLGIAGFISEKVTRGANCIYEKSWGVT